MQKKALLVIINEKVLGKLNKLLERYNVSQGVIVEMGLQYVLGLSPKDFEKEYLNHIKKG